MSPELAIRDDRSVIPQPIPSQDERPAASSDPSLSVNSIYEKFKRSRGLLTIGCSIKNIDDWDVARDRFVALISALESSDGSSRRSLAWALDMRGLGRQASVNLEKLKLLKHCLDGLPDKLETWMGARTSFLVATSDGRSEGTKVSAFFRDIVKNPDWCRFEAITGFQHTDQSRRLTFTGHASKPEERARWRQLDSCEIAHSDYGKKNRCDPITRAIFRIRRYPDPGNIDQHEIMRLEKKGLKFYSFEEFMNFADNYNTIAA